MGPAYALPLSLILLLLITTTSCSKKAPGEDHLPAISATARGAVTLQTNHQPTWLIYRNPMYGYEVHYPATAVVDTLHQAAVRFAFPRQVRVAIQPDHPITVEYTFAIDVSPNLKGLTPAQWFSYIDSLPGPGGLSHSIEKVTALIVDGQPATSYQLFEGDESRSYVYICTKGFAYCVSYQAGVGTGAEDFAAFQSVLTSMLQSLHFI